VTTSCSPQGPWPHGDPSGRTTRDRWITRAPDESRRRLQTDPVDLFQIHPAPDTDIKETLTDLVCAGKVRMIISCSTSDIVEAQWAAEWRGLQRFHTEQPTYSILSRIERRSLRLRFGMGTMIWSPPAQGLLTSRYRKGRTAGTHRLAFGFKYLSAERQLEAVEQLIPWTRKLARR
jgi:aryl-alcohol dehydrogenase-like predicted oxidoreductase